MKLKSKINFLFLTTLILQSGIEKQINAGKTSSIEQQDPETAKKEGLEFLVHQFPKDVLRKICIYMNNPIFKTIKQGGGIFSLGNNTMLQLQNGKLLIDCNHKCRLHILNLKDLNAPSMISKQAVNHDIRCMLELPDGRILTGGDGNSMMRENLILLIWNADVNGNLDYERLTYHTEKDSVTCCTLLPDGRVATGARSGYLKIWDPKTLTAASIIHENDNDLWCVIALPDGKLAFSGEDSIVRIWDPNRPGAAAKKFNGHTSCVNNLAALPNDQLASGSRDYTIRIWNAKDSKQAPKILNGHTGSIIGLCVLLDGRLLSAGFRDNLLRIWDPKNNFANPEEILLPHYVQCLSMLADGTIAISYQNGGIVILNLNSSDLEEALNAKQ